MYCECYIFGHYRYFHDSSILWGGFQNRKFAGKKFQILHKILNPYLPLVPRLPARYSYNGSTHNSHNIFSCQHHQSCKPLLDVVPNVNHSSALRKNAKPSYPYADPATLRPLCAQAHAGVRARARIILPKEKLIPENVSSVT